MGVTWWKESEKLQDPRNPVLGSKPLVVQDARVSVPGRLL